MSTGNVSSDLFEEDPDLEMGNFTGANQNMSIINCSLCLNELCIPEPDYELYLSWVGVDTYEMVLITINVIVFLTGIVGNSLVFIAVTTTKSMQSVTNIFIVNLALADILVMLFCAPPSIIWDVTNTWIFGSLMCRIVIYIQDISVSVSVLTLTFIAYDRYHAICKPLQFSSRRTKAAIVIAAIWSISALIGIPDAVGLQLKSWDLPCRKEDIFFDLSSCSSTWSENVDFSFTLMKALLLYTLPLIFMSVAYYHIVKTLWRSNTFPGETSPGAPSGTGTGTSGAENGNLLNSSSTAPLMRSSTLRCSSSRNLSVGGGEVGVNRAASTASTSANRNLDNQLKTRRKVAKMLIAVVIMFSINFFPVHLLPIISYVKERLIEHDSPAYERINHVLLYAGIITHCMSYFNSAINPIIYYFMSAQFKAQYRRILSCRCSADSPSPRAMCHNNRTLAIHNELHSQQRSRSIVPPQGPHHHHHHPGPTSAPDSAGGASMEHPETTRHVRAKSCIAATSGKFEMTSKLGLNLTEEKKLKKKNGDLGCTETTRRVVRQEEDPASDDEGNGCAMNRSKSREALM